MTQRQQSVLLTRATVLLHCAKRAILYKEDSIQRMTAETPQNAHNLLNHGTFHTTAEVIVIAGDSVRRLFALTSMQHLLQQHGIQVTAFSMTLSHQDIVALEAKGGQLQIRPYSFGAFHAEYKTYEHPAEQKTVIIVEMTMEHLKTFRLAKHSVQTLIFTDLVCSDNDSCAELRDILVDQVRGTPSFQTILYNNDLGELSKGAALLPVEDIPVRSHFSFGKSRVSTIHWSIVDNALMGSMPNAQVSLPVFDLPQSSLLRQEGIFAALSWLDISTLLAPEHITDGFGQLPLWEEHHGPLTLFWSHPFEHRSDIQYLLAMPQSAYLCIGMGPYLRFEEIIEQRIEQFETILVVAEDQNQVSLFQEYFLQKEKDSYHVIIYLPELQQLTGIFRHVFARAKNVMMLFDTPASFPPL